MSDRTRCDPHSRHARHSDSLRGDNYWCRRICPRPLSWAGPPRWRSPFPPWRCRIYWPCTWADNGKRKHGEIRIRIATGAAGCCTRILTLIWLLRKCWVVTMKCMALVTDSRVLFSCRPVWYVFMWCGGTYNERRNNVKWLLELATKSICKYSSIGTLAFSNHWQSFRSSGPHCVKANSNQKQKLTLLPRKIKETTPERLRQIYNLWMMNRFTLEWLTRAESGWQREQGARVQEAKDMGELEATLFAVSLFWSARQIPLPDPPDLAPPKPQSPVPDPQPDPKTTHNWQHKLRRWRRRRRRWWRWWWWLRGGGEWCSCWNALVS